VKVQAGYEVDLYADINYGGGVLKLTSDDANLTANGFNDAASSFRVIKLATIPTSDTPDFGANVKIFDPSMSAATIQSALDSAFNSELLSPTAQFGSQRFAFLFKPGTYGVTARLGFYEAVQGLGHGFLVEGDELLQHQQQGGGGALAASGKLARERGHEDEERKQAEQEVEGDGVGDDHDVAREEDADGGPRAREHTARGAGLHWPLTASSRSAAWRKAWARAAAWAEARAASFARIASRTPGSVSAA